MRLVIFCSSNTCTDCPKDEIFPRVRAVCDGGLGRSDPFHFSVGSFFVTCVCLHVCSRVRAAGAPVVVGPALPDSSLWYPGTFPFWLFLLAYKFVPVIPSLRTNTFLDGYMQGS